MGLLDWLTEGLGSSSLDGGLPMGGNAAPQVDTVLPSQAAPQQVDSPSLQPQSAYAAMPGGDPGTGPQPPVPLPQPRPSNADAGGSLPPLPTGNVPDAPTPNGVPPGAPTDISAQSATPAPGAMPPMGMPQGMPGAAQSGQMQPASGILGRAFGLNQQQASSLRGGLGAGLKSVGDNAHKPGLAAFAGSAGSAMEGTKKADDTLFEQRHKALSDMISAQAKGNSADYMRAQAAYLKAKTAIEQKKAADPNASKSVMSPEQRLVKVQQMLNQDQQIRSARDLVRTAVLPREKADAQAKLDSLVTTKKKEFEDGLTPGSQTNPMKPTSMDDAKSTLSPGQFFINPADGKLYRYKGAPDKAATPDPAQDAVNGDTNTDKDE